MPHWWTDTEPPKSKLEQVGLDDFTQMVMSAPPRRYMAEIILHHTWEPTAGAYAGRSTWQGIQSYHMNTNGWSDIGYHLGIAPDKTIWLLRPLQRPGAHCVGHNGRSIGVSMIGNFDIGHDDPNACGLDLAAKCVAVLCDRFDLGTTDVYFHRDFADKTCPGTGIDRAQFRNLVGTVGDVVPAPTVEHPFRVIDHGTGEVLWPAPNETWCVVDGGDHLEDQGKIYVAPR